MRTTDSVPFRPVFISPGHLIDFESSIRITRQLCVYREPEPLRLADRISRRFVQEMKKSRRKE
jgi:deoxyinosine 3'endonuclease (endonuclease V)